MNRKGRMDKCWKEILSMRKLRIKAKKYGLIFNNEKVIK